MLYGRRTIQVDAGIATLLAALWAAGIHTMYSCQGGQLSGGDDDLAYIAFPNDWDFELFTELVFATTRAAWEWAPRTEPGPSAVYFPPSDIPLIIAMCTWRIRSAPPTTS
ncbi:hypothetical protein CcI49_04000 [Frankia sp. CcI49]|nr:hypothetical protein ACG83_18250 [Frankia sp. R43]ONH61954.1 hypothetical protein CcI49_04000 [Frankia sp. CcI49]